jgi:hypothetical protein
MPLLESRASASALGYGFNSFQSPFGFDSIFSYSVPSGGVSSINIPVPIGYKSLQLRCLHKTNRSGSLDGLEMTFNNDTANNYSKQYMYSTTSAITGFTQNVQGYIQVDSSTASGQNANHFGVSIVDIFGYNDSGMFTTTRNLGGVSEDDGTGTMEIDWEGGVWASTSTVSSIQLSPYLGTTILQHSKFYLYGIRG